MTALTILVNVKTLQSKLYGKLVITLNFMVEANKNVLYDF